MTVQQDTTTKDNVRRFDDDVRKLGSYAYTAEKLSARYANARISQAIAESYAFSGKRVLDIGCGDGAYTLEFALLGVREIVGIDPAAVAVEAATRKASEAGLSEVVRFQVGNIYALKEQLGEERFDCLVLRGVLHHLPDPVTAIESIASLADTVIVLEPNGYNPVLKLLERFSRYHIEHEERSFFPGAIKRWLGMAGLNVQSARLFNLVPFFCPDWMARVCRRAEPLVENVPLLREIGCGQVIIVACKR